MKSSLSQQTLPKGMQTMYALGKKRKIDLSLSENPLGCSPEVVRALKTMVKNFNAYPSANGAELKTALANSFGLKASNFFIANGSESIIADLPRVFGRAGGEAVIPQLTFPMFKICCELAGLSVVLTKMTQILGIDLVAVKNAVTANTSLLFICNPNNPTGGIIKKSEIVTLLRGVPPRVMVVVDEANIEFGGESVVNEVNNFPNLIVLRTFSKGFGLASLRIGFAVASDQIIQKLEQETPLFPVSGISEKLAIVACNDTTFVTRTKQFVRRQRDKMVVDLKKCGFTVFPSQANNLFVKIPESIDPDEFKLFLDGADISVVSGSSFIGFEDRYFRVSIRDQRTNAVFLGFIKKMVD